MTAAPEDAQPSGDPHAPTETDFSAESAQGIPSTRFHWSRGGWIGAQFGSSCWMVPFSILVGKTDPVLGMIGGACFLALNIVGVVLWARRESLSAYAGIQGLIGAAAITNTIIVIATRSSEKLKELPEQGAVSADVPWAVIVIAPFIMFTFYLQKRAHDRYVAKASAGETSS